MYTRSFVLAGVCCAQMMICAPTSGQTIRQVALDEALQLLNENNLELQLSRSRSFAVQGEARQVRAFPNPTGQFSHEQLSGNGLSYSETYFNLRQPIPLPWLTSARSAASNALIEAAASDVVADSNRIQFHAKREIVQAIAADRRLSVVRDVADVFRAVERAATARFAEGDISGYDLRRTRIELARYERVESDALIQRDNARRRLTTALLPDTRDTVLAPQDFLGTTPSPPTTTDFAAHALTQRPELAARGADLVASNAQRRETGAGRWVDQVVLTAGYKRQSDAFDGPFLGAELPIPLWNRRGGAVAARDARVMTARQRLLLVERMIADDVRTTQDGYQSIANRVERTEDRLYENTDDLLDIARASYEEGETDLLDLLDAANAFFTSRVDQIALRAELWERYFDLERAVGGFMQQGAIRGDIQ